MEIPSRLDDQPGSAGSPQVKDDPRSRPPGPIEPGGGSLRGLLIAVFVLLFLLNLGFRHRCMVAVWLFSVLEPPAALAEAGDEGPLVSWFDDYFTVEFIDSQTVAIGEPRYAQQNYN